MSFANIAAMHDGGRARPDERAVAQDQHRCPEPIAQRKTILVVEDTDDLREVYRHVLSEAGYRVLGATNGKEALRILESSGEEPCLMLLDMMMPVMDGSAFLSVLRATHRLATLPIIIISANDGYRGRYGVTRLLKKPVSLPALIELVTEFCGQS